MTITVNYWAPHGRQVGHVSVGVSGSGFDCYVSWWPASGTKDSWAGAGRSLLLGVQAARFTYEQDVDGEGGRRPIRTQLDGLNEQKLFNWWTKDFDARKWSLLNVSCAQVAVYALREAGADKYITGLPGWLDSWQFTYWKPLEVHVFAERIKAGLAATR